MMDWTEQYLVGRANGMPLNDACGVATGVFAPGYVGRPDAQVLASTKDGKRRLRKRDLDGLRR